MRPPERNAAARDAGQLGATTHARLLIWSPGRGVESDMTLARWPRDSYVPLFSYLIARRLGPCHVGGANAGLTDADWEQLLLMPGMPSYGD